MVAGYISNSINGGAPTNSVGLPPSANQFSVNLHNSGPDAPAVQATFRIANFGLPASDEWEPLGFDACMAANAAATAAGMNPATAVPHCNIPTSTDFPSNNPTAARDVAAANGFSLNAGLEYLVTSHLSAEGIFGYHYFPAKAGGSGSVYQFSSNGKAYLATGKLRPFISFGIGGYVFSPGSTHFGGNAGGGVLYNLSSHWGLRGPITSTRWILQPAQPNSRHCRAGSATSSSWQSRERA